MNLEIVLGGWPLQWHLLDGAPVESWIASQQWRSNAGLISCAPSTTPVLVEKLSRLFAVMLDQGIPDVIQVELAARTVEQALADSLSCGPGRRAIAQEICTRGRYGVLMVVCAGGRSGRDTEDIQALRQLCVQHDEHAQLVLLLLVPPEQRGPRTFGLGEGWPVSRIRAGVRGGEWAYYLHERAAWHGGGRIDIALELAQQIDHVRDGDDAALSALLLRDALARLNRLPAAARAELESTLVPIQSDTNLRMNAGLHGEFGAAPVPVAWLAMALLITLPRHPNRELLRYATACRPLALRMMGRVMACEARMRDRLLPRCSSRDPSQETLGVYRRVTDQSGWDMNLEQSLPPPGFCPPDSPWQVASIGEILIATGRDTFDSPEGRLRRLRNALAHGSPVGWAALGVLDELERCLG